IDKNLGVVTSWKYEKTKEESSTMPVWNNCPNCSVLTFNSFSGESSAGGGNTGISGSISKFTIINDYLYVMDYNDLKPINISNPMAPVAATPVSIWREVETLFPYQNYIFMGTTTGM